MKTKLIIVATAVILIITVIILLYLHSTNEKEVVQRFQAEQLLDARRLAREIESYLHDRAYDVNSFSYFPSFQNRDIKKMTADIQTFFNYVKKDFVKAVSVYDEKGTIIYSTAKDVIGRNYGNLDFFQWATKKENKGKQFVSSLIRKTDDTTTPLPYFRFLIAAPIYQEVKNARSQQPTHKFIGIVTSTIDLEEIVSTFLPFVRAYTTSGHAYVLDRNGTVLFHSEHPEMVLRNIRLQDETCFKCHVSFDHVKTILSGNEGAVEYALKERPKKLASFSTTEIMNISWKIVISIPSEEVSGFVNKNLYMTIFLIGIITLTFIGGFSLIYRSNRLKIRAQEEAKQWMENHELENKIRESEKRYRTMIEFAHDIVWTLNTQGNFTFINSSGEKLTGHKISDWIGKSFIPLIFHEDLQKAEEIFLQTLKGISQSFDVRIYDIHGKIVILSVNTVPIYQDGSVVETVSFGRDITEQMQAEESLKASEEKYRHLVENLGKEYFFYRHGRDGVFTYVSNSMTDILGYSKQEFLAHHTEHHTDNSINKEAVKRTELSIQGKQQAPYEVEIYHKDKSIRRLKVTETPLYDDKGRVFAIEGIARDITERKRAEEALLSSEARYRNLYEHVPVMNFTIDLSGKTISVNRFGAAELGYTVEELVGKSVLDIFYDEDKPIVLKQVETCLQNPDKIYDWELRKVHKNGQILWVHEVARVVEENGRIDIHIACQNITERKQAEEEIKMLAYALRSVNECVSITDLKDKLIFVNQSFLKTYGYSEEELIGKDMHIVRSSNNPPELVSAILPATLLGGWNGELWNKRKDGSEFPIYLSTTAINDKDGKPLGLIGVAKDITERKRAEEEIIQIKEKMQMLVEGTPHLFFYVQDANANIQYISPSVKEITGHTVEQWCEQNHWFVTDSEINQSAKRRTHAHLRGEYTEGPAFLEITHANGNIIFLEAYENPIIRNNKVVGLQGVAHDITQRKRAEEEIIFQKNKFAQLFENSPIAIALLDDQDKVVHINESFSALFGYFLEEIKGKFINDLIVPPELKEEAETYSNETHGGNQINKESYRMIKDGTLVYVQIIGVPAIANDKVVGIYSMYVDLTQRKVAEEKMKTAKELAEQSDKLKSEFLAQMSHEIRTPINIMTGNVDYLKDLYGEKTNSDTRECFDGIDLASKRIIRTVDLILNVAELQTSGYNPYKIKVDLNSEILNKLYKEHQLLAKQKGLEFIYSCKERDANVIADSYSITQIFANLIDNAIKYTKKGKVEILLLKNKTDNIMVEIKDTGIGMSKEFLPKLFEPFLQEEQGFTRSYDGSGLGLTLVKNYCDINNAAIEVESEKNVGTTFRIIFKS
ncbi:MAG: PAS domain S-box protein [Ignavibacteriales bacterium]|nr:PAS domain S-box protein [Ignavibacteriales bacterium]